MNSRVLLIAAALLISGSLTTQAQNTANVIVYGSTPGGFCAAIAAAREGASVILLEPTTHVGGMNTGGLSFSDSNQMYRDKLMGLFHEWHLRIQQDYQSRGITLPYDVNVKNQANWSYEPHVATRVTNAMLSEAGVAVLTGRYLQSVQKIGPRITGIVTSNGSYTGRVFIDGSYEGDLMHAAGVSWTIGREGRADFGESRAGKVYPKATMNINGFDGGGNPLPLVTTTDAGPVDEGDDNLMTYSFRLSITTNSANRVPYPAPTSYDPARFEVMRRYIQAGGSVSMVGYDQYSVPNNKADGNNSIAKQFSLGFIGAAKDWHTADEAGRAAIFEAHKQYTLEFLYFLANDPVFTPAQRSAAAQWGLCADEFPDTNHFPPQLYVRESRRMQGIYFITENDIISNPSKPDPIMVSSFPIDSHDCQRVVLPDGKVVNEGTIYPVKPPGNNRGYPYHVPYRAILPQPAECDNLLVPVALSCTHVAISSLRIEATWMLIGQGAGIAAAMTADRDIAVQDLPYADLKPQLEAQGQILTLPDGFQPPEPLEGIVLDDPEAVLTGTWTPSTNIKPYVGDGYRFTGATGTPNDGSATATFRFIAPQAGIYQLNMAYSPDASRATNVPLIVTSGPHVTNFSVDQTVARPAGSVVRGIGLVQLAADAESVITLGTGGTTGFVIFDALQLVLDSTEGVSWSAPGASGITANSATLSATLLGNEAEVTLFWKAGGSAPQQFTGWDGNLANPGVFVSPGLVQRTITGLQADTLYSCIHYASNSTIPAEAWSAPLSFATALTAAQAPAITSVVVGESSITLSWQDHADTETGYIVQRATAPDGPYTGIATLGPNATSYVDRSLSSAGTYYYRVAAANSANASNTDFSASQTNPIPFTPAIIVNGGFETGDLSGWTLGPANSTATTVSSAAPLAGTYSAVQTPAAGHFLAQTFAPATTTVTTSFIFTAPDPGDTTFRSMNVNWRASTGDASNQLNLRLVDVGDNGVGDIQVFSGVAGSGGSWQTVLTDAVTFGATTTLTLTFNSFGASATYDLTVGSSTATGISFFQGSNFKPNDLAGLYVINPTAGPFKFDNVSVTPVPANDFDAYISNPAFDLDLASQGFGLDPDNDNLANGLEAWFGTHPGESNAGLTGVTRSGNTITFTHPENANPPSDIGGFYQWSPDLQDWYAGDGIDGPVGGPTVVISPATVGTTTTVTATASGPLERLFLRAVVVQN